MDRLTDTIRTAIKQAGDRAVVRVTAEKLRRILDRTRMARALPGRPRRRHPWSRRRRQEASGTVRPVPSPCA